MNEFGLKLDPGAGDADGSNSLNGLRSYRGEFSRIGFEASQEYGDRVATGRVCKSGDNKRRGS